VARKFPITWDGRDNLLEALLDKRNQATIAHHERQADYTESEPAPEPIRYHSYAEFAAYFWK
jgi:hypothetical protein